MAGVPDGKERHASMARNRRGRGAERSRTSVAPGGLSGGSYQPLKAGDLPRIVEAAMEVLERTGIQVAASPCRETFRAAGCRIDDGVIYCPPRIVTRATTRGGA